MNVISKCYRVLFGQHGLALFDLPVLSQASEPVRQALHQFHLTSVKASGGAPGIARVGGKRACRIPGGMRKLVAATCSQKYAGTSALFEPLESGLPAVLLASPALVKVENNIADLLVINVNRADVLLYPRTRVGTLVEVTMASLPAGVTEVSPCAVTMASQSVS